MPARRTARVFLLSPAHAGGERARMLTRDAADFPLARRLRSDEGAPLGDVFAFLSGLYFRGKLAYARAFAHPPRGLSGALVITPTRGLLPVELHVTARDLREFAAVDIHHADDRYRAPLARDLGQLVTLAGARTELVLLGSIATRKYVDVLLEVLGERLLFPPSFVGRGDMSRGGLLLRCAREGTELDYAPVAGAVLRGKRPPKLPPRQP